MNHATAYFRIERSAGGSGPALKSVLEKREFKAVIGVLSGFCPVLSPLLQASGASTGQARPPQLRPHLLTANLLCRRPMEALLFGGVPHTFGPRRPVDLLLDGAGFSHDRQIQLLLQFDCHFFVGLLRPHSDPHGGVLTSAAKSIIVKLVYRISLAPHPLRLPLPRPPTRQSDRTITLDLIAFNFWTPPLIYYLIIVVQARDDYGGRMLETMREVRATPAAPSNRPPAIACPCPPAHARARARLFCTSVSLRSLF